MLNKEEKVVELMDAFDVVSEAFEDVVNIDGVYLQPIETEWIKDDAINQLSNANKKRECEVVDDAKQLIVASDAIDENHVIINFNDLDNPYFTDHQLDELIEMGVDLALDEMKDDDYYKIDSLFMEYVDGKIVFK